MNGGCGGWPAYIMATFTHAAPQEIMRNILKRICNDKLTISYIKMLYYIMLILYLYTILYKNISYNKHFIF